MPSRQRVFEDVVLDLEREFLATFPGASTRGEQSLSDRIRRAISWMKRASAVSHEDRPPRFVDLWIAFNALYGCRHYGEESSTSEYQDFQQFLAQFGKFGAGRALLGQLMGKQHVQGRVRDLVQNKYLWNKFWEGKASEFEWEAGEELKRLDKALRHNDAELFFKCLFERLKVLRNQIFHGSASADTRRNRDALVPGVLLLEELLPALVHVMIRYGSGHSWPCIPYPARRTPLHPESD